MGGRKTSGMLCIYIHVYNLYIIIYLNIVSLVMGADTQHEKRIVSLSINTMSSMRHSQNVTGSMKLHNTKLHVVVIYTNA